MDESPKKNFKPSKGQTKTMMVWGSLIMLVFLLSFFSNSASSVEKVFGTQELMNAAAEDAIVEMTIRNDPTGGKDWYVVTGELKNPEFAAEAEKGNKVPRKIGFKYSGRISDEDYKTLTQRNAPWKVKEVPASTLTGVIITTILPILIIIGFLWFIISRQLKAAGKSQMGFGKSRARLLSPDKDRVTFDDVAGCDEAKEEVSEIVDFLRTPEKFNEIGAKIPKGILMVGPPGTGKTLLARAIAGEANVPFYSISGSDFVEMFVGVGAARVRDMFEQARKNAPCLIFIDEIDAVGRQRGAGVGGGHDEREQTLNSLLVEMDGFDGHEGVIIIAATNRPDVLDSALLRPGRFDRQVMIDLPDANGREAILKIHAAKIKLDMDVNMEKIAKLTPGASGADLANLLNEGAITAARRNSKSVSMSDIEIARDKILYGREHRRLMTDDEKRLIAYHEGGHALVQVEVDKGVLPVHKVTIIPRGQSLGSTMFLPERDMLTESKPNLLNRICAMLGGRVAEEVVFDEITNGAASDISQVTKIARKMVCDWGMGALGPMALGENQEHIFLGREIAREKHYSERTAQLIDDEIKKIIDTQHERARRILTEKREALNLIAEALVAHETIDGSLVYQIARGEVKSLEEILAKEKALEAEKAQRLAEHKDTKSESGTIPAAPGGEGIIAPPLVNQ